jgi:hypothetical protein
MEAKWHAHLLQIWQIADTQNRGLLTPSGFGVVLRLIGHAQAGQAPTEELALQRKPFPVFRGHNIIADVLLSGTTTKICGIIRCISSPRGDCANSNNESSSRAVIQWTRTGKGAAFKPRRY